MDQSEDRQDPESQGPPSPRIECRSIEKANRSFAQQLDEALSELGHLVGEMAGQGTDPASSGEYIIHFFQ